MGTSFSVGGGVQTQERNSMATSGGFFA